LLGPALDRCDDHPRSSRPGQARGRRRGLLRDRRVHRLRPVRYRAVLQLILMSRIPDHILEGVIMTGNTSVVVIGGGYARVRAANRLTSRDDVTVTLINPRPAFVERIRLHQLLAGNHDAVTEYRNVLAGWHPADDRYRDTHRR